MPKEAIIPKEKTPIAIIKTDKAQMPKSKKRAYIADSVYNIPSHIKR
jgi:hypothetical protein